MNDKTVLENATVLLLALQKMLAETWPHSEDPDRLAEVSWDSIVEVVVAADTLAKDVTILTANPPNFTMKVNQYE